MRALWTGSISFGLVNIPVRLHAATRDHDIPFHQLHRADMGRVRYRIACEADGQELSREDIVKGYEYSADRYVTFEDDEMSRIALEASKTVDILDFVSLADVDPVYFQKAYYASPQKGAAKAYHLLREALARTGRVAVANLVLRSKGNLALIRPKGDLLVLETMFYSDEIAPAEDVPVEAAQPTDRERELAETLIGSLTVSFDPSRYRDVYRDRLEEAIARKIEGKQVAIAPARERAEIIDLQAALEESLKKAAQSEARSEEFRAAMPEPRPSRRKSKKTE